MSTNCIPRPIQIETFWLYLRFPLFLYIPFSSYIRWITYEADKKLCLTLAYHVKTILAKFSRQYESVIGQYAEFRETINIHRQTRDKSEWKTRGAINHTELVYSIITWGWSGAAWGKSVANITGRYAICALSNHMYTTTELTLQVEASKWCPFQSYTSYRERRGINDKWCIFQSYIVTIDLGSWAELIIYTFGQTNPSYKAYSHNPSIQSYFSRICTWDTIGDWRKQNLM